MVGKCFRSGKFFETKNPSWFSFSEYSWNSFTNNCPKSLVDLFRRSTWYSGVETYSNQPTHKRVKFCWSVRCSLDIARLNWSNLSSILKVFRKSVIWEVSSFVSMCFCLDNKDITKNPFHQILFFLEDPLCRRWGIMNGLGRS